MFLDTATFTAVLNSTPLISLDLIVQNTLGQILLGQRSNRPAKGYWFVPGGRIRKNESMATAFKRLTLSELGESFSITQATLQGPYDHFYSDCVFGDTPSTHYVALAFQLKVNKLGKLPLEQHAAFRWFNVAELLTAEDVHKHTKAYFISKD